MKLLLVLPMMLLACKPATGPTSDAEAGALIEAGTAIANGVCSLIEGIDDNGTVRNICATVDEVAAIVSFITSLRTAPDAGLAAKSDAGACSPLPTSTFCATSAERAKGILHISKLRTAKLTLDGGSK